MTVLTFSSIKSTSINENRNLKLQSLIPIFIYCFSAEKQGFEPWEQLPVHRISSAARSTTPASLQKD